MSSAATVNHHGSHADGLHEDDIHQEIADQLGVPVGWDIYGQPNFSRILPAEYTLNTTPPPPTPAVPGAIIIAPPKQVLD